MAEKEYIEVGAVLADIDAAMKNNGLGYVIGQTMKRYIKRQPTADVVEVKHGKWIYHECVSSYDGAISGYSCSECNSFVDEEIFDSDEFHKNFCGHCGAKMDGATDNNVGHKTGAPK